MSLDKPQPNTYYVWDEVSQYISKKYGWSEKEINDMFYYLYAPDYTSMTFIGHCDYDPEYDPEGIYGKIIEEFGEIAIYAD